MKQAKLLVMGALASLVGLALAAEEQPTFFTTLDLSVPRSAAQAMLKLDPKKVDSSSKLTDLALSYVRGGGSGAVGDGFSISMSLLRIRGDSVLASDWKNNDIDFRLTNFTQLSAALVAGSDEKPAQAAFGIALPFQDETDWRTQADVEGQYGAAFKPVLDRIDLLRLETLPTWDETLNDFSLALKEVSEKNALRQANVLLEFRKYASAEDVIKVEKLVEQAEALLKSLEDSISSKLAEHGETELTIPPPDTLANIYDVKISLEDKNAEIQTAITDNSKIKESINKDWNTVYDRLAKQAAAHTWNRKKSDVSLGVSWGSEDNTYENFKDTGKRAWVAFTTPLAKKSFQYQADDKLFKEPNLSCVTVHLAYLSDYRALKDNAFQDKANGHELGLSFRMGGQTQAFFIEGLQKKMRQSGSDTDGTSWTLGFEKQLQKKQWLQISIGSDKDDPDSIVFGLGLSFNFSEERELSFSKK